MLTEVERHRLLVELNDTACDYPRELCIHQLFEAQTAKTPEAVAVVHVDQRLSYAELNARANQLAHYLRSLGVGPDTRVCIALARSFEMIVALLATLKAGGAYVPLDPDYPFERLAFMLADTEPVVVLTQDKFIGKLSDLGGQLVCLDSNSASVAQQCTANLECNTSPLNLAYIIYTSGSTGKPKGVAIPHRGIVRLLFGVNYVRLDANETTLMMAPATFDAATFELWAALLHGGCCVLFPDPIPSLTTIGEVLHKYRVSTLWLTSALFNVVIDEAPDILRGVSQLLIGGEALSVPHVRRALALLPTTRIINGYGPTESTTFACCYEIPRHISASLNSIPIGRPIGNTSVYVLDNHLNPVSDGMPGELHIGGDGLARGYFNRPELTAEKFIRNPFSDKADARLYKTGDWVRYLPDGNIEFLGRMDHQVKIRGFRIELGEIEAVLKQLATIRDAIVLAREDQPGNKRLVAYVVPMPESSPTPDVLREYLRQKLPDYMVPSAYVILQSLPLTPNGKVDRQALPVPDQQSLATTQGFVPPSNPAEQILSDIWADVLGVGPVGINDNFFELGGHSLLATQVVARIRDTFKCELSLRTFFELPSVAQLAGYLLNADSNSGTEILPIGRTPRGNSLPLSFAQQRLWFIEQLHTNSSLYNVAQAFHLKGLVNIGALERSINELVARHEALRTTFTTEDGEPMQVIAPTFVLPLPLQDLRGCGDAELWLRVHQEAQIPFDLSAGPLIRSLLIRVGAEEHVLVLSIHHIVFDGWSVGVILRELSALYYAYSHGLTSPLAELPIQYADYAVWQRLWLQGEVLDRQLGYWKQQLASVPIMELPTDRPRPPEQSYRGASETFILSASLTSALGQFSRKEGATLFMTLLAAFEVLLSRYTNQEDIVVGTPIAGRNRTELGRLIGFFVNTLVLRGDLSGNPSFTELLARTREMALDAYTHQDLPFEKLVSELAPQRNLSYHPLFQIMFILQNASDDGLKLEGLNVLPVPIESNTAKFDLMLSLTEVAGEIEAVIEYSTDLFDATTIARMAQHYLTLLEGIITNPQARLSELPILTWAERQRLLAEWNDTASDYPRDLCIHQLFEAQAARTPDAIAVVHEDRKLCYAELNARANQLAHYLRSLGVGPDVRVCIALERSFEMIIALLATLKAGGAYVPLDPDYPFERLAFMLEDSGAEILITQESLRSQQHTAEHILYLDAESTLIAQQPDSNPLSSVTPEHLAYVIYTSGSTGKPKGVAMPHGPLCNLINWQLQNTPDIRANTLQYTTLSFDVSFQEIFSTFAAGASLFLIGNNERRDARALIRLIQAQKIERLFLPFVALANLSEMVAQSGVIPHTLRCIITAGEQLNITSAISQLFEKTGASLHNHYGPTESHVVTSFSLCKDVALWPFLPPIGRPIANTQLYVLDRHGEPTPIGIPGELHIGGDGVARGYLNRPELTAEKFIRNPFGDKADARLYKTGDRVRYLADGNIEFLGRMDNQVKVRGFRVEPGEIETVLLQHPFVLNALVQLRRMDSGENLLIALIVKKQNTNIAPKELTDFLKTKLPAYLVPDRLFLTNGLTINANGKLDRGAMQNVPLPKIAAGNKHQKPYTALQATLLQIWSDLLENPSICVEDNFFESGGDSFTAVMMLFRVEKSMGWSIPLVAVYSNPTIELLALAMLEHKGKDHRSPLVEIQAGTSGPPFFFMHGDFHGGGYFCYSLAQSMGVNQTFYALHPHGLPGRPLPSTIENMANEYLALIREAFPEGPYFLGGHCNGALVAFEIAQRLMQEGSKVGLLIMMDPPSAQNAIPFPAAIDQFKAPVQKDQTTVLIDLDKMPPVGRHSTLLQIYNDICNNYVPKFYQGKLTMFMAEEELNTRRPGRGWGLLAAEGELHVVPGDHVSMITEHTSTLAKKLMECKASVTWD